MKRPMFFHRRAFVALALTSAVTVMAAARCTAQTESVTIVEQIRDYNWDQLDCADSANCMGIYHAGLETHVRRSTDGGRTWRTVFTDTLQQWPILRWHLRQYSIAHPDAGHCFVSCDSGAIRITADSGATWNERRLDSTIPIANIAMADSLHGIASQGYTFCVTHDGWKTLRRHSVPAILGDSLSAQALAMPSPRHVVVAATWAGTRNGMLVSDDGGDTWSTHPGMSGVLSMSFADTLRGWAAGGRPTGVGDRYSDRIWRTDDGGRSWTAQLDTVIWCGGGLLEISAADRLHAIAAGGILTLYRTSDGGDTWAPPENQPPEFMIHGRLLHARTISYPVASHAVGATSAGDGWVFIYERDNDSDASESYAAAGGVSGALWPNPVAPGGACTVHLEGAAAHGLRVAVIDMLGREIHPPIRIEDTDGGASVSIATAGMGTGTYFLRAVGSHDTIASLRLVVR